MDDPTTQAPEGDLPSLEEFNQAIKMLPVAKGITKTTITARLGNRIGSGKVEVEAPQWDESAGGIIVKPTGNSVVAYNINGIEMPPGITVYVTPIDSKLFILNFDRKCSVRIPGLASLYFLTGIPKDPAGLEIRLGDWVDVPSNFGDWPEGTTRPELLLCREKSDPKHHKLFRYRGEIEWAEWEDAGLEFGGTFTPESWEPFAKSMASFMAPSATSAREGA